MDEIDFNALTEKINEITLQNIKLLKDNKGKDRKITKQQKVIDKLQIQLEKEIKKNKGTKQHYRNGQKRGANGRNG